MFVTFLKLQIRVNCRKNNIFLFFLQCVGSYAGCYTYNPTTTLWEFLTCMNRGRSTAASVTLGGALWVTGGDDGSYLASTELIKLDGTVTAGTNLPLH